MTLIGYHASHEQFSPSRLVSCVRLAEAAGFRAAKSSDHFKPWSERQGQSGFAWSWLGAAMQATAVPFGIVSAPGYRYHPAVLAQAAATIGEMFPGRLWFALGSGEALNEAITGEAWPEKAERNARLRECADVIRALFEGAEVSHRGRVTVIEAKLYSRPEVPVPLYGAAVSAETARFIGTWADGLLTTGGERETTRKVIDAFHETAGDKPVVLQAALSWAPTEGEAMAEAMHQWAPSAIGGEVAWDLRRPRDFDTATQDTTENHVRKSVHVSSNLGELRDWIAELGGLGIDEIHLHNVGRNQEAFIEAFGTTVLPGLS